MNKYFFVLSFFTTSCNQNAIRNESTIATNKLNFNTFYSKTISDCFYISINLPNDYFSHPADKYPVVYLLDANVYFDILAVTLNKYSEIELASPVILVGIGYKDLLTMDSLRNRDYTYPIALPEYEMKASGGANKFLAFITSELIPYIDKEYQSDTSKRILAGHSLGGYFSCYALTQNLLTENNRIDNYIAASPSLNYNNYYLLEQIKNVSQTHIPNKKIKTYISFGGLEDEEDPEDTSSIKLKELTAQISLLFTQSKYDSLIYKCDTFSNLGHMDTPMPSFIKGLRWILNEK